MARGYDSPGVGYSEEEVLPQILGPDTLAIGIVGGATKGKLDMTLNVSTAQAKSHYGNRVATDYGVWALNKCLNYSGRVYYKRVIGKNAALGKTGDVTDDMPAVFITKEYDSTLEGANVKVTKVEGMITYRLVNKGIEMEVLTGFNLVEGSSTYLFDLFNKKSIYLDIMPGAGDFDDFTEAVYTITGCNDGIDSLTAEDIIQGMQVFKSPDNIDISTLITPGWSDDTIIEAAQDIIDYRGDFQYIPDPPNGLSPREMKDWADAKGMFASRMKFESPNFVLYYPWILDYDLKTREEFYTPVSGWVAAQYAYNDSVAGSWFAPAGLQDSPRGLLRGARGLAYQLSKEERDMLYSDTVVNSIVQFQGKGIALWGNKTAKRTELNENESAMTSINVRRLCNYIRKIIIDVSLTEIFNQNDETTWNSWKLKLDPRLRAIKDNRGLEAYRVQMDRTTISEEDINNGRMPAKVYIKPTRAAEWIPVSLVVTSESVIFEETGAA